MTAHRRDDYRPDLDPPDDGEASQGPLDQDDPGDDWHTYDNEDAEAGDLDASNVCDYCDMPIEACDCN